MDRRGFLRLFGAGVAGIALDQAIPLGRVWSFPSELFVARNKFIPIEFITAQTLRKLQNNLATFYEAEAIGYYWLTGGAHPDSHPSPS
jgi:hypothetical protein